MQGVIFDIQRFCVHDGPGIRTTVFFKGCPLSCEWCHNPESQRREREIFFTPTLCIGCDRCVQTCPRGAGREGLSIRATGWDACQRCFRCADICPSGAIEAVGREIAPEEVMTEVLKDRIFYDESGGGLTLSGGEPMSQFEFAREILLRAKAAGVHTCVETSGFGPPEHFAHLIREVDLFLWDVKETDPGIHQRRIRTPLGPLLDNLLAVDRGGGQTLLRCVIIPGINLRQDHLDSIAALVAQMKGCLGVELLPYHGLGESKYQRLGRPGPDIEARPPTEEELAEAKSRLERAGISCWPR